MPTDPQQPPRGCPAVASPSRGKEEPGCARPPGTARPLPDPAAVRLWQVPESAPPYDPPESRDIAVGEAASRPGAQPGAGPEPAHTPGPEPEAGGWQAAVPEPGGEPPQPGPDAPRQDRAGTTGMTPRQSPPDWPSHFARVLVETLAGSRPSRQIVPWTTERARTHIRRLGSQLSASRQQPRVRRVMTYRPACDVVEMTVVVGYGPRVRALAVRLERAEAGGVDAAGQPARAPRWMCTAVEAA